MRILVTGGCGYIGSALVPALLNDGHSVDVVDTQWFGENLAAHSHLRVTKAAMGDVELAPGYDCIIHLAAVANDPCGELDPKLTWEANALATMRLIDAAWRAGVRQFIYASSGSVYGVKTEERVTEALPCEPLSEYNKTKMVAERVVLSYADRMTVQVLRPATVCGYSPRTRLDVAVNALTIAALTTGKITVFGGEQVRPNVHISDMVRAYQFMLSHPNFDRVYNVGFENHTLVELALMVQEECGGTIHTEATVDIRSYRLCSDKMLGAGFIPRSDVRAAIRGLKRAYQAGKLHDTANGYNLRVMPR